MSNVVDFLEKLGSEAQWRHASQEELELALAEADIAMPERSAILAKDASQLQVLMHQPAPFSVLVPPDEEEGEEDEENEGDEGGKKDALGGLRASSSATSSLQYA
jgi:hypothetical protein